MVLDKYGWKKSIKPPHRYFSIKYVGEVGKFYK